MLAGGWFFFSDQGTGKVALEKDGGIGAAVEPGEGLGRGEGQGHARVDGAHYGIGLASNQGEAIADAQARQQ